MTANQQETFRRLHLKIGRLPARAPALLTAGEVRELLNALWDAERRADVAEAHLSRAAQIAAEERLERLLPAIPEMPH